MKELNAPDALINTYWTILKGDMGNQTKEGLKQQVRKEGPDKLRAMSNYLYDNRFAHRMSREDYDNKTGMKQWEDDQPGIIGNTIEAVKGFFTDEEGNKRAIAETYWNTYKDQMGNQTKEGFLAQVEEGGDIAYEDLKNYMKKDKGIDPEPVSKPEPDVTAAPGEEQVLPAGPPQPGVIREDITPQAPNQAAGQIPTQQPAAQPMPDQQSNINLDQGPGVKATGQDDLQLDAERLRAGARTPNRDLGENTNSFGNVMMGTYDAGVEAGAGVGVAVNAIERTLNRDDGIFYRSVAQFNNIEGARYLEVRRAELEALMPTDESIKKGLNSVGTYNPFKLPKGESVGLLGLFKPVSKEEGKNLIELIQIKRAIAVINAVKTNTLAKDLYFEQAVKDMRATKYNAGDITKWEDVKNNPLKVFQFALEHGIKSTPYMVMAALALPAYITSLAGSIAEERAINNSPDKEDPLEPEGMDLIKAFPFAFASGIAERFSLGLLFKGIGGKAASKIVDKLNVSTGKGNVTTGATKALEKLVKSPTGAVKKIGKKVGTEGAFEAFQGGTEGLGEVVGTDRWDEMKPLERVKFVAERALIEGVVGALFGGVVIGGSVSAITYDPVKKTDIFDNALNSMAGVNRQIVDRWSTAKDIKEARKDVGKALNMAKEVKLDKEQMDTLKELDRLQVSLVLGDNVLFIDAQQNYQKFQKKLKEQIEKRRVEISTIAEEKPLAKPDLTAASVIKKIQVINNKYGKEEVMTYQKYIEENNIVDNAIDDALNLAALSDEDRAKLEPLKQARAIAIDPDANIEDIIDAVQTMNDIVNGPEEQIEQAEQEAEPAPDEQVQPEEQVLPEEPQPEEGALPLEQEAEQAPEEVTPEQPTETPTETPEAVEVPDNPTIEGKVLEEKQKLGDLFEIPIEDVSDGDAVTVDVKDGNPPVSGILTKEILTGPDGSETILVSIKDKAGNLLSRFRAGAGADPTKPTPSIYADQSTVVDPDEQSILDEINRLMTRAETDPNAIDEIRRIRSQGNFRKLSEEERNRIDDFIKDNMPVEEKPGNVEDSEIGEQIKDAINKPPPPPDEEGNSVIKIGDKIVIIHSGQKPAEETKPEETEPEEEPAEETAPEETKPEEKPGEEIKPEEKPKPEEDPEEFKKDLYREAIHHDIGFFKDNEPDPDEVVTGNTSTQGSGGLVITAYFAPPVEEGLNVKDFQLARDTAQDYLARVYEGDWPVSDNQKNNLIDHFLLHAKRLNVWNENSLGYDFAEAFELNDEIKDAIKERIGEAPRMPETDTEKEALELFKNTKIGQLANKIITFSLKNKGKKLSNEALFALGAEVFGGTIGDGAFDAQDAYNALELSINLMISDHASKQPDATLEEAIAKIKWIEDSIDYAPTQTVRTDTKEKFQQFSTPPAYAYAINWLANINETDSVLEPSAGNGGIAVFSQADGAAVTVNELDKDRLSSLKILQFDHIYNEDAEHLSDILPPDTLFDAVVMNPPFSAAGHRGVANTSAIGAQHVLQAFKLLKPGGRMVIITGQGFTPQNGSVKPMFKEMGKQGQFRAITGIEGNKVYRKYGTSFDNKLIIFDKTGIPNDGSKTKGGHYESLDELITDLEEIRHDRPETVKGGRVVDDGAGASVLQATPEGKPGEESATSGAVLPIDTKIPGTKRPPGDTKPQVDAGGNNTRPNNAPTGQGLPSDTDNDAVEGADGSRGGDGSNDGKNGKRGGNDRGADSEQLPVKPVKPGEKKGPKSTTDVGTGAKVKLSGNESSGSAVYESPFNFKGSQGHRAPIVEPVVMAVTPTPDMDISLVIPEEIITAGILSDVQLTAVLLAINSHELVLPDGLRQGFMIGDGTGLGKGREIMGIILDNFLRGREKSVWISVSKGLFKDADRDRKDVDATIPIHNATSTKSMKNTKDEKGIIFTTYDTLKSSGTKEEQANKSQDSTGFPMVDHLLKTLGKDFDGVIAFDESHKMGASMDFTTNRGKRKASATGKAGRALRDAFPNARIVYVSATGATTLENLSYMERLGLWGKGTAFNTVKDFIAEIDKGGASALELVALHLKQTGRYIARSISFDGVENRKLEHVLSAEQTEIYDALAEVWQTALENIEAIVNDLYSEGTDKEIGSQMAKHMSQFWGSNQRFYNQINISMNMPSVLKQMHASIAEGMAPVIQMVNTNEAQTRRALAAMKEGDTYDDLDITPRNVLMNIIDNFPIHKQQIVVDEDGNETFQTVYDSKGVPVEDRAAVAKRDKMRDNVRAIRLPDAPIDMIINEFGRDQVAEITGRSQRVVEDDRGENIKERRTPLLRDKEAEEFQNSDRKILIFTEAGGTGFSYHASNQVKNKKRRAHFILQAGWRADIALQGIGRTNRTDQDSAPVVFVVSNNTKGSIRFSSAIAARMGTLGALTRGTQKAQNEAMDSPDVEGKYGTAALRHMLTLIAKRDEEAIISPEELKKKMGLNVLDNSSGRTDEGKINKIEVSQFLNRLLNVSVADQDKIYGRFEIYMNMLIRDAVEDGTFDAGLEVIDPISAKIVENKVIHVEKRRGGETKYINIETQVPNKILTWGGLKKNQARALLEDVEGKFYRKKNRKGKSDPNGKLYWIRPYKDKTEIATGSVIKRVMRFTADNNNMPVDESTINEKNYDEIGPKEDVEKLWKAEEAKLPKTKTKNVHLITGSLLDVYDSLPTDHIKLSRVMLGDGDSILGRQIHDVAIDAVLSNFGHAKKQEEKGALDPEDMIEMLMEGRADRIKLNNKSVFSKKVAHGEERIQIKSDAYLDNKSGGELEQMGFIKDKKDHIVRFFLPNGPTGVVVLRRYMERKWITSVKDRNSNEIKYYVPYTSADRIADNHGPSVEKELRELVDKLAPSIDGRAIKLRVLGGGDEIYSGRQGGTASGYFKLSRLYAHKTIIAVVLNSERNPRSVLRHEVIHALKYYGLFTEQEWDTLLKAAKVFEWDQKHAINLRYADLHDEHWNPTEAALEEAIAEEFADYIDQKIDKKTPSIIRQIFKRIKDFFVALTYRMRGYGVMPKPGSIFDKIESGEIGNRVKKGLTTPYRLPGNKTKYYIDPEKSEFEKQFDEAWVDTSKDVKWITRVKDAGSEQYRMLTRTWEGIPHDSENSAVRDKLTHLMAAHKSAENEINSLFKKVMGKLPKREIELLTMKMLLDDLLYTAEKGMKMPFGLETVEDVIANLQKVEAQLKGKPHLIERLDLRTKFTADIRMRMIESGVLNEEQAKNPNYFRHQVIEFAIARRNKSGSGGGWDSYWHKREGSEKAINTNYFQAEADWLYKAFNDVATANFINWLRTSKHNMKKKFVQKAKNQNKGRMKAIVLADRKENGKDGRIVSKDIQTRQGIAVAWKYFNQAIKMNSGIIHIVPEHLKDVFMITIEGELSGTMDDEFLNDKFQLLQFFAKNQIEGISNTAAAVMGAMNNRRKFIREILGEEYINPLDTKGLIKRYGTDEANPLTVWQHESRTGERRMRMFTGKTISEHVLDRIVDQANDPANTEGTIDRAEHAAAFKELEAGIKSVVMMGGPMEEMILPEGIARTLDVFHDKEADTIIGDLSVKVLNGWKRYILFNPISYPKYLLNNYVGDTDALVRAGNIWAIHKILPRAHVEMVGMIYKGNITDDLRMANDYGVISTTQTGQEIDREILDSPEFREKISLASLKKPFSLTWRGTKKYFEIMQTVAQVREAAYRYAVFIHYMEEFNQLGLNKKTLLDIGYGASNPAHIQTMLDEGVDYREIAAKMAREVMGDYGAVPQTARAMRHRLIPFVSWIASNTVRYTGFLSNTYREARDVYKESNSFKDAGVKGVVKGSVLATSTAVSLTSKMIFLYTMAHVANNLFFPDEEDLLTDHARSKMHIILGYYNGFIITLNMNGGFSDFADWFNLDELMADWMNGRTSVKRTAKSIGKGAFNKILNSLTPFLTIPIEMFSGKVFFPDIFDARNIRNRVDHIARNLRLSKPVGEIKELLGYLSPQPTWISWLATSVVRLETPQQLAYIKWRSKSFEWEEETTGESVSSRSSPKGNALYAWKLEGKYDNPKKQKAAYDEYIRLGGSRSGFKRSLKASGPLGNLSSKQRREFLATLTDQERSQVSMADKWWNDSNK